MTFPKILSLRLAVVASTLIFSRANAQTYTLQQDLSGENFFQGFKFNESAIDFNNFGNVHFLSQSAATAANLTYVDSNGRVIIKVDNTTSGVDDPNFGRNSVYLESEKLLQLGSLVIFDANFIPFGCSVWPSLFTQGQSWPAQGEIDIIENVNLATANRYSLHVGDDSCSQPLSVQSNQTGTINTDSLTASGSLSNCTVTPSTGQNTVGCVTTETKSNSFGSGFASQGGGVYAMLWDDNGIAFWYFARANVPSNIGSNSSQPDPTTWGMASAWYPASACDPKTAFGPQIITLYIDICGAFAGTDSVFQQTCASVAPNCSSMVPVPTNYDNAYWEINYLRVYTNGNSSSNSTGSATSPSAGASSTGTSNGAFARSPTMALMELLLVPATLLWLGLLTLV